MDKEQFYSLVEEHYKKTFHILSKKLTRYLGNKAVAEDVLQEAYCRLLQYWETYKEDQPFEGWFKTVVNNSIRDHYKKEHLHGMLDDGNLMKEEREEAMLRPFFERIELNSLLETIKNKPYNVRKILTLYLVKGYSSQEVEKVVPESSNNIRKIVQRFRDEIK